MSTLAFLTDVPDVTTLAAGEKVSRVQIAKTGKFKDPRYGTFTITTSDFDKWEKNFSELSVADGRLGLPIDVDHSPEKTGNTEAAGWVTKLDRQGKDGKTGTPTELWATAEWNSLGQELLNDKRYAYLSPSYQHNFADETGATHGTALVGIGLTNRPFLTMATVSLSKDAQLSTFVSDVEDAPRADSLPQMTDLLKNLRTLHKLPDDADDAAILAAATAASEKAAKPAPTPPDTVDLSALAQSQGMVLSTSAEYLKLAADAASGAAAAKELHDSKFESAFTLCVNQGQLLPVMKDTFLASYGVDPEACLKTMTALPKVLNVTLTGHTGDPADGSKAVEPNVQLEADNEGWAVDNDQADLDRRAKELMAADANLTYLDAVERCMVAV